MSAPTIATSQYAPRVPDPLRHSLSVEPFKEWNRDFSGQAKKLLELTDVDRLPLPSGHAMASGVEHLSMDVDAIGQTDQGPFLHQEADHAFDHFRLLRNGVDQFGDRRRLQAGIGKSRFDRARELSFLAAEFFRAAWDVEGIAFHAD